MRSRLLFSALSLTAGAALLYGQGDQIRATYKGGGSRSEGKCTLDLVVDGAVDVEIRGETAVLHNLSGQPARWRRFECTGPMPLNPPNFRYQGVEGRGKQQLIRDPRDGGVIVVRIEDPDSGSEGYKFDLTWQGTASAYGAPEGRQYGSDAGRPYNADPGSTYGERGRDYRDGRDQDAYHRDRDNWNRGDEWRTRIFERVREDVEHVQYAFQSDDDRRRLSRTVQELNEMQGKLANGVYDQRELSEVIDSLERVLRDNRLAQRDGEALTDDLHRLREFRARHSDNGDRSPY